MKVIGSWLMALAHGSGFAQECGDVKNDFMPLTDGHIVRDVFVEENEFPFTENDTFIKVALEEVAKLDGSQ